MVAKVWDAPDADVVEDRDGIAGLPSAMTAAWNAGDAEAYGALFTSNSDYVAFDGTRLRGRHQNVEHHLRLFETVLRDTRLRFEGAPEIRLLTADVAIMHACGSVLLPWQNQVPKARRSIQTYVVRRTVSGWRIEAFHNTRCKPLTVPQGARLKMLLLAIQLQKWVRHAPASALERLGRGRAPRRRGPSLQS